MCRALGLINTTTYTHTSKFLEKALTLCPSQRTEEDAFWVLQLFRLNLCWHSVITYGLGQVLTISIACSNYSTHWCQVRKEQRLGDYSCQLLLGQMNGCRPSCVSPTCLYSRHCEHRWSESLSNPDAQCLYSLSSSDKTSLLGTARKVRSYDYCWPCLELPGLRLPIRNLKLWYSLSSHTSDSLLVVWDY